MDSRRSLLHFLQNQPSRSSNIRSRRLHRYIDRKLGTCPCLLKGYMPSDHLRAIHIRSPCIRRYLSRMRRRCQYPTHLASTRNNSHLHRHSCHSSLCGQSYIPMNRQLTVDIHSSNSHGHNPVLHHRQDPNHHSSNREY